MVNSSNIARPIPIVVCTHASISATVVTFVNLHECFEFERLAHTMSAQFAETQHMLPAAGSFSVIRQKFSIICNGYYHMTHPAICGQANNWELCEDIGTATTLERESSVVIQTASVTTRSGKNDSNYGYQKRKPRGHIMAVNHRNINEDRTTHINDCT